MRRCAGGVLRKPYVEVCGLKATSSLNKFPKPWGSDSCSKATGGPSTWLRLWASA